MVKFRALGVVIGFVFCGAGVARSESYIKGRIGDSAYGNLALEKTEGVEVEGDVKSGTDLGLAYEMPISDIFAVEFSLSHTTAAPIRMRFLLAGTSVQLGEVKTDLTSTQAFVTGLFTKKLNGTFYPYVGFGLGMSQNTLSDVKIVAVGVEAKYAGSSRINSAWQLVGGLDFDLTDRFFAGFGLKVAAIGEANSKAGGDGNKISLKNIRSATLLATAGTTI